MQEENTDDEEQPALLLMTAAQDAAEAQVRFWIQSVLRETALQAVRLQWNKRVVVLASSKNNNNNHGTPPPTTTGTDSVCGGTVVQVHLDLSDQVITNAQLVCRSVAHKWSEHLKEMGLHDVARWIDEIVQAENEFLYYHQEDTSSHAEGATDENIADRQNGSGDPNAATPTTSTTADNIAARATTEEDARPSRESNETTTPHFTTTWAKLRHLGQRDILSAAEAPPPENDILPQLHRLGAQNATYWPIDQWNVVQAASADITTRLYSNVPSQRADNEVEALQQSSAFLSSSSPQQPAPPEDSSSTTTTTNQGGGAYPQALEYLLLRKRSKRRRIAPRRTATTTTTTTEPSSSSSTPDPPPSRDASADNGHFRLSWENDILADHAWSAQEKMQLDALLHDNNNNNNNNRTRDAQEEEEPRSLLLGSLQDLGRFHYFSQLSADYQDDDDAGGGGLGMLHRWHEKQKRRRQNEAQSVRLGDHVKLRTGETEYKKMRMSRVAHTAAQQHGSSSKTRNPPRWLDLDLGYCMLESVDATTGHRTLYAFGNLELFLLDEDNDVVDGL